MRCAVDGGPLDWTTASLSPVFLRLLLTTPVPRIRHCILTAGIVIFGVGLIVFLHADAGSPEPSLVGLNSALALLSVVVATLWAATLTGRFRGLRLFAGASVSTVVLALLSQDTFWAWDARAWWRTIPAGDEILLVDYYGRWDFPVRAQEGTLAIRTLRFDSDISGAELYRRLGIRHHFTQAHPLNLNCSEHDSYERSGRLHILEGAAVELTFLRPILREFQLIRCASHEDCTYRYRATIPGCIPDSSGELLVNRLFEAGATKIILVPDTSEHSAE